MISKFSITSLLKNSLIYGLSDILLKLIGFFLVPIYTRAMSPEQYGLVGYANAVSQILVPLLGLGVVNCLPMLYYSYSEDERKRLISSAINFVVLFGLVISGFFLLFTPPLFEKIAPDVLFAPYVVIAFWVSFLTGLNFLPLGVFNIQGRPLPYLLFSMGLAMTNVAASILFVIGLKMGALGVLYALLISGIFGFVATLFVLRKDYVPVIDRKLLKVLLVMSLPVLPHLVSGALNKFADRFFLASMSTMSTTGMYSLALVLVSPVLVVMGAVFSALNPMFYKRAAEGDTNLARDWGRLATAYFWVGAMAVLGVSLFAKETLAFFAPGSYSEAVDLMPVLAVAQMILGLYWILSPSIGYTKKTWVYSFSSFVAIFFGVSSNVYLIPIYGAFGAAVSTVISAFSQFIVFFIFAQKYYFVRYDYNYLFVISVLCLISYGVSSMNPLGLNAFVFDLAIFSLTMIFSALTCIPARIRNDLLKGLTTRYKRRE